MELHHVGIVVRNLEAAKAFASEVLGLTLEREGPVAALGVQTAFYRAGGALLEFVEYDDPAAGAEKVGDATARIDHLALQVGDLAATRKRLEAAGGSFEQAEPLRLGPNDTYFSRAETTHGLRLQLFAPAAEG